MRGARSRCRHRQLAFAQSINQLAAGRVGTPQWMTAWLVVAEKLQMLGGGPVQSSALQAESHRNAVAALALGELAEATARSTPTAAAASPPLAGPHTVRGPATATAVSGPTVRVLGLTPTAASSPGLTFAPRIHPLPNNFFLLLYALLPSSLITQSCYCIVFFLRNHRSWCRLSFPRPTLGERDAIRLQTALNPLPRPSHLIQSAA